MKKLMIAASAALCAAVGFAVESSNIVGYQTKGLASANYTMINVPFVNVADSTAGLQLNSDIEIANVTADADDSANADQIWVWIPSENAYSQFFRYAGDGGEYAPGWCDLNDADWNYIEDCPGFENGLPLGSAIFYKAKTGSGKAAVFASPL